MTILVVGGSGFIGTCLTRRLLTVGHEVRIFDKIESTAFPERCTLGDVRDRRSLSEAASGVEAIYNLAAEHRDDVRPISLYDEVNVGGAENVVAAAEAQGVERIVFTSTVAVYPLSDRVQDEASEPAPFNDYGRTKLVAEKVFEAWQAAGDDRSLIILRPTVVFGKGNRGNVYNLIRQIARGRFVMVGPGENRKALAYVENVAAALAFALGLGPGHHLFNYTDQPDYSMESLVREIRTAVGKSPDPGLALPRPLGLALGSLCDSVSRVTGRPLPISRQRIRKFCSNTCYGSSRIRARGFEPEVALPVALIRTIESELEQEGSD